MLLLLGIGVDVTIQTNFQFRFGSRFDSGSEVNSISPDDRTGVGQAWDGRLPAHVHATLKVPCGRQGCVFSDAARPRPAELRPICCGTCDGEKQGSCERNQD